MTKAGEAVVEHAADQLVLAAEVVVHRGVVAVAGGRTDLSERHAVDAVFGEQSFRGDDDAFLGRTRLRRHGQRPTASSVATMRDGLNGASGANAADERQRVVDGVDDRGGRADRAAFAHALVAARRGRRGLDVAVLERRDIGARSGSR